MKDLLQTIKANTGITLTALNIVLVLILVLQYNPLGIYATGYAGASSVLPDTDQASIARLEIVDPDFSEAPGITLLRGDLLPREQWKQPPEDAWIGTPEPRFAWKLQIGRGADAPVYDADRDRVNDLFEDGLQKLRRYNDLPRTAEKDRDLEMGRDDQGQPEGLHIKITMDDGAEHALYIGRATLRGDEGYVRLDDEDRIFRVETNLRSVLGPGEVDYFRSRSLFPAGAAPGENDVVRVDADYKDARRQDVSLAREGGTWSLLNPPFPGKVQEEAVDALVNDIINWKASSFINEEEKISDLNRGPAMTLRLTYKSAGNLTDRQTATFEILGRRNFSSYVVRTEAGTLLEISSIYLEDLESPREKFVGEPAVGPQF